jgi:hypothetical protein
MADNTPVDVIQSHQDDDRDSVADSKHEHDISAPVEPQTDPDDKYTRDVPPDGGYGWVCVACVFWINAHTWGINSVSIYPFL